MHTTHRIASVLAAIAASAILATPNAAAAVHLQSSSWIWQNPVPQGDNLNATSCPSATTCYAVGDLGTILATTDGGIVWNGQFSTTNGNLRAISCPSATTCVAAGDGGTILFTNTSGAAWSKQSTGTSGEFTGVSCPSTSVCYAVGPAIGVWATFSLGTAWHELNASTGHQAISCPNPAGASATCYLAGGVAVSRLFDLFGRWFVLNFTTPPVATALTSISCPNATTCAAAALGGGSFGRANVIWTTNSGSSWTSVVFGPSLTLNSISCVNSLGIATIGFPCYAVGVLNATSENVVFEGAAGSTSWTTVSAGDKLFLPTHRELSGISCQPAFAGRPPLVFTVGMCFAVGQQGVIVTDTPSASAWTLQQSSIGEASAPLGVISGVSCPQAGTCFAVGRAGFFTSTSGGPWTLKNTAVNASTVNGNPISCQSITDCFVVGTNTISATTDGGGTWKQQYPAGAPPSALTSVSCPSAQICVAAGQPYGFITTNGSTWSIPPGNPVGGAVAVTCPNTTTCMAVTSNGAFTYTTNLGPSGGSWTGSATPAFNGNGLSAISCPTTTTCLAVGGPFGVSFLEGTFNTGSKIWGWTILTPPPLNPGDSFASVSCLRPSISAPIQCYAGTFQGAIVKYTTVSGLPSLTLEGSVDPFIPLLGMSCAGTTALPIADFECAAAGYQATILTKTVGSAGTGHLTPGNGTSEAGAPATFSLEWTVPSPQVWRDLEYVELKLIDDDGAVGLWARFIPGNPASVFALLDGNGNIVSEGAAGTTSVLDSPSATLDLSKSSFQGSGPTGPSVTVNFGVSFNPAAAGNGVSRNASRVYHVEIAAAGRSGVSQAPENAGSWAVRAIHP